MVDLFLRNEIWRTRLKRPFDIELARSETKACASSMIHFNNAGASLMPIPVAQALHNYLTMEEEIGGYETQARYQKELEHFYRVTAQLLNCSCDEIAFVDSATRGWDLAFYAFKFYPGDIILTSLAEYGSNVVAYIQQAKRFGVEIKFVPNDEHGQVDINELSKMINDKVKLISITHIPTGGGLVNPVRDIGKVARAHQIPFLLDACQSIGQMPLDVEEIGCDILCGTGRKYLRGPRATGVLYVRKSLLDRLDPPFLDQHAAELISPTEYRIRPDARRFELWEQNCAGKVALAKAIDYALSWGLDVIRDRIYKLAEMLRFKLADIEGITVADQGRERCGIVTFYSENKSVKAIQEALATYKINVCISQGSGSLVPFLEQGLSAVIRASVHYYNTESEINSFIDALNNILKSDLTSKSHL